MVNDLVKGKVPSSTSKTYKIKIDGEGTTANSTHETEFEKTGTHCTYGYNNEYNSYCAHRLPCGVCRLMNSQCPKTWMTWEPSWNWHGDVPTITYTSTTGVDPTIKPEYLNSKTNNDINGVIH